MIVKNCKIHGDLTEEQCNKEKYRGKPIFRCSMCRAFQKAKKTFGDKICIHHGQLTDDQIKPNGRCRLCHRASASNSRDNNREQFNKKQNDDREKNPEKWDIIYKKVYQQQKAKFGKLHSLKKCCDARGITLEQYYELAKKQNDKCAICFQPETRLNGITKMAGRLTIDHCHKTNKVRGLLCHNCNTGIGKFFDNTVLIIRAARYVKGEGF